MSIEAIAFDGSLRPPLESGERGKCFECYTPMTGRMGVMLQPHWAHVSAESTCQYASESVESHWHKAWKYRLEARGWSSEQTHIANGEKHRADVVHPGGTVVELQNRYLDPREIMAREDAYSRMLWVMNGAVLLEVSDWDRVPEGEWLTGRLRIEAGAAKSMHYMRRPVIIDNATHSAFQHSSPRAVRRADEMGNKGVTGLFYVGNWNVSMGGGTVDVQAIHVGNDPERAAAALDDWFKHLRWAA